MQNTLTETPIIEWRPSLHAASALLQASRYWIFWWQTWVVEMNFGHSRHTARSVTNSGFVWHRWIDDLRHPPQLAHSPWFKDSLSMSTFQSMQGLLNHSSSLNASSFRAARFCIARKFSSTAAREKQRVVILGSGWGGYGLLRGIDKKRYGMFFLMLFFFPKVTRLIDAHRCRCYLAYDVFQLYTSPSQHCCWDTRISDCHWTSQCFRSVG